MRIRFIIDVNDLALKERKVNPFHHGWLIRDVDWPARPMVGDPVAVANDASDWGELDVTRVTWTYDGIAITELGMQDQESARELQTDEPSWKFSKNGAGWPEWNGSIPTNTLEREEWEWIRDAVESVASEIAHFPADLLDKVNAVIEKG